jgi:pre-mRNA-splicing factor CDC5/CEF1
LDPGSSKLEDDLERQIMDEMVQLLSHDAVVYPIAGGKIPGGGRSDLAPIEDEAIAKAKEMVHLEMANSCGFPGANAEQIRRVAVLAEEELFKRTWEDCSKKYAFDARTLSWVESSTLDENQKIGGLKYMIDEGRTNMIKDANACNKAEKKLTKLVGGYQARSKGLSEKLRSRVAELDRYQIELASFERLEINEQGAARRRLEKLEEEVQTLTRRGREGQDTYKVCLSADLPYLCIYVALIDRFCCPVFQELVDAKALLLVEVEDMKAEITVSDRFQ